MTHWLEEVHAALQGGADGALATVTDAGGSTPRHRGARMAVLAGGGQLGTVGGGRLEQEVVEAARAVGAGAPARVVRHHLTRDLAMCCGGWMEVVVASLAPSRDVVAAGVAARRARSPRVLETPRDGGPLALRPPVDGELARLRRPAVDGDRLLEAIVPADRVILFGAGHVGRALGPVLRACGFEVVLCDDGDTGALDQAPPWADRVVESFDAAEVAAAVGGLGAGDHVVIVTRDHAVDQRILEQLIDNGELAYLGMIGSRGKVGRFHKRLVARGVDAAAWSRLRAPIGLDIGAETPAEIAVAVAAELVALRRRGEPRAGDWSRDAR